MANKTTKKCTACKTTCAEHSFEWEVIKNLLKTARLRLLAIIVLLIFWLVSTSGFIWCLKQNKQLKKEIVLNNTPNNTIANCITKSKANTKRKVVR